MCVFEWALIRQFRDARHGGFINGVTPPPPFPFRAQIVAGFSRALQTALDACDALAETIDVDNGPQLKKLVDAAVGTKFSHR